MKRHHLTPIIAALCLPCLSLAACGDETGLSDTPSYDENASHKSENTPDAEQGNNADETHSQQSDENTGDTETGENTEIIEDNEISEGSDTPQDAETPNDSPSAPKHLGGLSPDDALGYMKTTPGLAIIEVTPDEMKFEIGITGAIHIPYTEMDTRYNEIPDGVPVILYCRIGKASTSAYATLLEKRPDIPELSYIAGVPPIDAYNEWYAATHNE